MEVDSDLDIDLQYVATSFGYTHRIESFPITEQSISLGKSTYCFAADCILQDPRDTFATVVDE